MTHSNQQLRFRQHAIERDGIFTRREALEHGITDKALKSGTLNGLWLPAGGHGIYRLHGCPDNDRARLRTVLHRGGDRAIGTGVSALNLFGLDVRERTGDPVGAGTSFISVPPHWNRRIPDINALWDARRPQVVRINGLPIAARERAIVDAFRALDLPEARAILYRCLQLDWITADRLGVWADAFANCRGAEQLRLIAEDAASGPHAESERVMHQLLERAKITGWTANEPVYDERGLIGRVDIAIRQKTRPHLAIEVDGHAWHTDYDRFEHDRERQNRLVTAGWKPLRYTWHRLSRTPEAVIQDIRAALE